MKNILFLTAEYWPESWGGISTITRLYVQGFLKLGFQVRVAVFTDALKSFERQLETGEIVRYCSTRQFTHRYHSVYWKGNPNLEQMGELLYLQNRETIARADYIICNNEELYSACEQIRKNFPSKWLAYFCHGFQKEENPGNSQLRILQDRLMAISNVVLTASAHMKRQIQGSGLKGKIEQIIPPFELYGSWYCKYAGSDRKGILAAGRMVAQKGFDYLLEEYAASKIRYHEPLTIYSGHGDAKYEQQCRRIIIEMGLEEQILKPWLDAEPFRRKLGTAVCTVMCSRFEPLGMVAAESLLAGTPVISAKVGGIPEILGYGDERMFCTHERGSLAECLDWLLTDFEMRQNMAERGRAYLLRNYTLAAMEESWKLAV